jgi:hypothetical protein
LHGRNAKEGFDHVISTITSSETRKEVILGDAFMLDDELTGKFSSYTTSDESSVVGMFDVG